MTIKNILLRKFYIFLTLFCVASSITLASDQDAKKSVKIDEKVREWNLKDTENKIHTLKKLGEEKKAVVLIFLATQCPVVDEYVDRINSLHIDYKEKKVQFVGIHSNKHETIEEIKKYSEKHKLEFPILKDPDNELADYFNARRTPEIFLIDSEKVLRYRGAIDDSRESPKNQFLRPVLDLLLEGKTIPEKQKKTRAIGCLIKRVRKTDIDRTP